MRAIVDAGDLAKALREVSRATPKRRSLPILANVLLTAGDGRLRLTCTDLERVASREIPARGVVDGATTVPARLLRDLASELRDAGPMLLERQEQQAFPFGSTAEALLVMVQPYNFVAHLAAISAAECPAIMFGLETAEAAA